LSEIGESEEQPFDAGNRAMVRERNRNLLLDAKDREAFMRAMLDCFEGRAWFADLLFNMLGLFRPNNPAQPAATTLHKEALRIAPDQYMVCMRENRHKM